MEFDITRLEVLPTTEEEFLLVHLSRYLWPDRRRRQ